jgi:hypothetical protein
VFAEYEGKFMRGMLKEVLGKIGIFVITLLFLAAFLVVSAMIDPTLMHDNLVSSAKIVETEPLHAEGSIVASQKDRAADGILFNMIWNTDPKHPVMSTIKAAYYERQDKDVTSAVEETLTGGKKANALYIRYWHGTETFVRPMLLVTDIRGIRVIQAVALAIISLILMAVLFRKKYYSAAILTVISFLITRCFYCVISIEFISVPIIALIISIVILYTKKSESCTNAFFISGILVAFYDFLTAETLTLTIPMLFMLYDIARRERAGEGIFKEKEGARFSELTVLCVKCAFWWFVGYAITFLSRWLLAAVTGVSTLDSVWERIGFRMNGSTPYLSGSNFDSIKGKSQKFSALASNIGTLFGCDAGVMNFNGYVLRAAIIFLIAAVVIYLFRRSDECHVKTWHYIVIFLIPIVRILVVGEHSYRHHFFTYRALWASVLALFFILSEELMWDIFRGKKHD